MCLNTISVSFKILRTTDFNKQLYNMKYTRYITIRSEQYQSCSLSLILSYCALLGYPYT